VNAIVSNRDTLAYRMAATAGILGALGVLIGAFGAHGLEAYLAGQGLAPELIAKRTDQFDVGARYHLIHAVALLAVSSSALLSHAARLAVFVLFTAGVLLFSGSLYLLVATNTPWLGAITPIGGVSWIIAWTTLAISAFRQSFVRHDA
jgi:uncharacterized membrane protein YgdD (TMEM256/DUF423 family)